MSRTFSKFILLVGLLVDIKLGCRSNYHKVRAATRHYANQPTQTSRGLPRDCKTSRNLREPSFQALNLYLSWHLLQGSVFTENELLIRLIRTPLLAGLFYLLQRGVRINSQDTQHTHCNTRDSPTIKMPTPTSNCGPFQLEHIVST